MTAIVGFCEGKRVWVGGDSCFDMQGINVQCFDTKVFQLSAGFVVGTTGDLRMNQVIRYCTEVPTGPVSTEDSQVWLVRSFVPTLRDAFKQAGCLHTLEGREDSGGGWMLVGLHTKLFMVDASWGVAEPSNPFAAIGSGDMVTLGALSTLRVREVGGELAVREALAVAASLCPQVRAPFTVIST